MAISRKPLAAALGAAFLATSLSPLASAETNPFSAQQLSGGYDLANFDKHAEGKCGDDKAGGEGKCGEGSAVTTKLTATTKLKAKASVAKASAAVKQCLTLTGYSRERDSVCGGPFWARYYLWTRERSILSKRRLKTGLASEVGSASSFVPWRNDIPWYYMVCRSTSAGQILSIPGSYGQCES